MLQYRAVGTCALSAQPLHLTPYTRPADDDPGPGRNLRWAADAGGDVRRHGSLRYRAPSGRQAKPRRPVLFHPDVEHRRIDDCRRHWRRHHRRGSPERFAQQQHDICAGERLAVCRVPLYGMGLPQLCRAPRKLAGGQCSGSVTDTTLTHLHLPAARCACSQAGLLVLQKPLLKKYPATLVTMWMYMGEHAPLVTHAGHSVISLTDLLRCVSRFAGSWHAGDDGGGRDHSTGRHFGSDLTAHDASGEFSHRAAGNILRHRV
jgi:hypothetical protein